MRKVLGLQCVEGKFIIVLQSHKCSKFGLRDSSHMGYTFRASNGVELSSSSCPDPCGSVLYLRGDDDRLHVDWRLMDANGFDIRDYMAAAREYNEKNK